MSTTERSPLHEAWSLKSAGKLEQARKLILQALLDAPRDAEAWYFLAMLAQEGRQAAVAIELYDQAITLCPGAALLHLNRGVAAGELGRDLEAIRGFRRAVTLDCRLVQAHYNLGKALHHRGALTEAAGCYRQAIDLDPTFGEAWANLGALYQELGEFDNALIACRRALCEPPQHTPALFYRSEVLNNLANAHRQIGEYNLAETYYLQALATLSSAPEPNWNYATLNLLRGRLAESWPAYEWRWHVHGRSPPQSAHPRWDGSPLLHSSLLLHAEQGLGDMLQFIRFARLARERVGRIVVECPRPLASLLARVPGVDVVVPLGDRAPDCDVSLPLASLPGIFRTGFETLPAGVPYVRADDARQVIWAQRIGLGEPGIRVGLVWQGNRRHRLDAVRSFPLQAAAALAKVPGIRLFSLQHGDGREQLDSSGLSITDLGSKFTDFDDTAAAMQALDLIVTCDSAPAHLAGALGLRVWLALNFSPDWRWLLDQDDSPWYPTMRLFRQASPGNWSNVFEQMAAELSGHDYAGS